MVISRQDLIDWVESLPIKTPLRAGDILDIHVDTNAVVIRTRSKETHVTGEYHISVDD